MPILPLRGSAGRVLEGLNEVERLRTATQRVFKAPGGGAHLYQIFQRPVNYRDGDRWRAIDTSLEPVEGGFASRRNVIEPFFPARLSNGNGPQLRVGESTLELRLNAVRPSDGVVTGDRVTYADALPYTDVTYVATRSGLAEHVVLRSAKAPNSFSYTVSTKNLALEQDEAGNIHLVSDGDVIGVIAEPYAEESVDGVQAGGGDALLPLGFELSQVAKNRYDLTVTIDSAWLDDPVRRFPVLVDPDVSLQLPVESCTNRPSGETDDETVTVSAHCFYREAWKDTWVESAEPNNYHPITTYLKVGRWSGNEAQSFFDFPILSTQPGADIIYRGDFRVHNYWSQSSTNQEVNLREIDDDWVESGPEALTWNRRPPVLAVLSTASGCGNNHSGCAPWHSFDITSILQRVQNTENANHETSHGWRLGSGTSESEKRFDSMEETKACRCEPYLLISANDQPSKPELTAPADNARVTTEEPELKIGDVIDENGDQVYVKFEISPDSSFSEFENAGEDQEASGQQDEFYDSGWIAETGSHVVRGVDFEPGVPYHWRVRSADGYRRLDGTGVLHAHETSAEWSFVVEDTPPTKPFATSTSHIRDVPHQDQTVDMVWTPSVDLDSGLAGYSWAFSTDENLELDESTESNESGTSATSGPLDYSDAPYYFHIAAVDNVGNMSEEDTYGPIRIRQDGLPEAVPPKHIAQSDTMGLEQFMPFRSHSMGPTATAYVHLRNGNLVVSGRDVTVPGIGLNAVVSHTYNSGRADKNTGLGNGWTLSVSDLDTGVVEGLSGAAANFDLNAPLAVGPILNATGQAVGSVLEFVDGDGTTHRFVRNSVTPGGRWLSPPGVSLRVREVLDDLGQPNAYELVRPDGVTYRAELCLAGTSTAEDPCQGDHVTGEWRVVEITDRNNNQLSFDYVVCRADIPNASCGQSSPIPMIRVAAINHEAVTSAPLVSFLYDTRANLADIISLPGRKDSTSGTVDDERRISYVVDDQGDLTQIVENPNVTTAEGGSRTTRFEYNGAAGQLTDVVDSKIHGSSVTYDRQDRAKTFSDRGGAVWSYTYGPIASNGERDTTVAAPPPSNSSERPQTVYRTSGRHGVAADDSRVTGGNIIRIEDASNNSGNVVEQFEWEQNLLVKRVDGLGRETLMRYNALNLVEEVDAPSVNDSSFAPDGAPTGRIVTKVKYEASPPPGVGPRPGYGPNSCAPPPEDPANPNSNSRINDYLYCQDVADIVRTTTGLVRNAGAQEDDDSAARVVDFVYDEPQDGNPDKGNLESIIERAANDPALCGRVCSPQSNDRVTDFTYLGSGLIKKIDGPRTDVADVTTVGRGPNHATCSEYSEQGLPLCIVDAADNEKHFTYNGYGLTRTVTDREGRTSTNLYDVRNNLTSAIDPEGDETKFGYDVNDNQTTQTSPRGTATSSPSNDFVTVREFDRNDRVTHVWAPGLTPAEPYLTEIMYYPDGSKKNETNPAGHTTTYEYFPNQQLKRVIEPALASSSAETTITYDAAGQRKIVTFPSSGGGFNPSQEAFYSPAGTLVRLEETSAQSASSSQRDRVTRFVFNAHGEQAQIVGPRVVDGVTAKQVNSFDSFGQMTAMKRLIRPNAAAEADKWLTYSYDYDLAGNQTKVTQPLGLPSETDRTLSTDYTYDSLNQLRRQTDPQNPGDANTGPHITVFSYDKEGAQTSREDHVGEPDPSPTRSVTLVYNDDGSLRKKEYLTGNQQLSLCNWEAGATDQSSGYDADGNLLVSRSVRGPCGGEAISTKWFRYAHDGFMDRLTQSVKLPSQSEVIRRQTVEYRPDGALQKSDWKAMTRDANGDLVDAAGTTKTTNYTNSPAGWMTSIQDWRTQPVTSTFEYRPSGVMHSATLGDNITGSFTHHPEGSLSSLLWEKGTTELRKHSSMVYDLDGLLTAEDVAIEPTGSGTNNDTGGGAVFGYDLANRLKSWTSPFAPTKKSDDQSTVAYHSYSLDDAGNILTENVGTTSGGSDISTTTSTYPNGRLEEQFQQIKARSSVGVSAATTKIEPAYSGIGDESTRTTTLTSDETPNASTVASRSSEYDAAGHTSKITDTATFYVDPPQGTPPASSPETVEYYYDADDQLIGRRHQKGSVNVRAFFYFLGGSHLAEEVEPGNDGGSGAGSTKVTYLSAVDGKAVAEQKNSDWIWLLRDPTGTIATRVKAGGDVVSQQAYDPYGGEDVGGTTFSSSVERENPSSLGFQGSHTDQNTGNLLLGPRIYDPTIDRFTTPDYFVEVGSDIEIGTDPLTSNRYLFAGANPVAFFEDGHALTFRDGAGGGGGGFLRVIKIRLPRPAPPKPPSPPRAPTIKPGSRGGPTAGKPFSKSTKQRTYDKDPSKTCVYCGRKGTANEVDHAQPKSRGGNATIDNAQLTCSWCNRSKGAGDFPKNPPPEYEGPWPPPHWHNLIE